MVKAKSHACYRLKKTLYGSILCIMQVLMNLLRRVIYSFVFGNIYISICAVVMFSYTCLVLRLAADKLFLPFVFFAALTSYSFHWYLTKHPGGLSVRMAWTSSHRKFLLVLMIVSLVSTYVLLVFLKEHFMVLLILGFITFMYTAPKIPLAPFRILRKIAVLKTTYLALVWTAVTVILPLIVSRGVWDNSAAAFIINRLFLIFPICVLFDYRDRKEDSLEGIKNIATVVSSRGLDVVFFSCLFISAVAAMFLFVQSGNGKFLAANLAPLVLLALTYRISKHSNSDLWYYVFLDGMMMFSGPVYLLFSV